MTIVYEYRKDINTSKKGNEDSTVPTPKPKENDKNIPSPFPKNDNREKDKFNNRKRNKISIKHIYKNMPEIKKTVETKYKAYIKGYEGNLIKPNAKLTRAEVAMMISNIKGLDKNITNSKLSDVDGKWYSSAINNIYEKELIKGYPDGSYKPDSLVTRAEFVQIIKSMDKNNVSKAPFTDIKGHWAEDAINIAYGNGRIKGYGDGTFKPDANITRAEAATILNSLTGRKIDKSLLDKEVENGKNFADLDKNHWAYYELLSAATDY